MPDTKMKVRNAIFIAANGGSIDDMMAGSVMAQAKLLVEHSPDIETAEKLARHYLERMIDALPMYWAEKATKQ